MTKATTIAATTGGDRPRPYEALATVSMGSIGAPDVLAHAADTDRCPSTPVGATLVVARAGSI